MHYYSCSRKCGRTLSQSQATEVSEKIFDPTMSKIRPIKNGIFNGKQAFRVILSCICGGMFHAIVLG